MKIMFSPNAEKTFLQLDKTTQNILKATFDEAEKMENPRSHCKGSIKDKPFDGRFSVCTYRVVYQINKDDLFIYFIYVFQ